MVAFLTLLHMYAGQYFEQRAYCAPLLIATCYGVWRGGRGPGIASLVAGAFASFYMLAIPRFSILVKDPADVINVGLYIVVGVVIILFGEALHRERHRVVEREAELRRAYEKLSETNTLLDKQVARKTEELREIKNYVAEEMGN